MVSRKDEEVLMQIDGNEQGAMPIIGAMVSMGGTSWRCIMVAYVDTVEGKPIMPEIRVYYRQEAMK